MAPSVRSPNKCPPPEHPSPRKIDSTPKLRSPLKTTSPSKFGLPIKSLTPPRKPLSPAATRQLETAHSPKRTLSRKLFQSPTKSAVDVYGVMSVVNEVYSSSQSIGQGADELPLQQRLAVCSLMLILINTKSKEVTIAKVGDNQVITLGIEQT